MSIIIESEKDKLISFFNICDEMIGGKFILADIKISKILKSIASCDTLYNLFSKCLLDFNFREELKKSIVSKKVNGGFIVLPDETENLIAFVFHMLVQVDNKTINLQSFINEYFYNPDGYNFSYASFSRNILIPFKRAILKALEISDIVLELQTNNEKEVDEDMEDIQNEDTIVNEDVKMLYTKLMVSLSDLYSAVLKDSKICMEQKEEVYIIVSALNEATRIQNIKIINALIIPLEYVLGKHKGVKQYYNNVKDDLIDIYNELR